MMRLVGSLAVGLVVALVGWMPGEEARAQGVGAVSALVPTASRTDPRAAEATLGLRDPVFMADRIATSAEGSTRITFADASELTVGPASDVLIDRFVYAGGSGTAAVRVGLGAVRFVGGAARHDVTVTGPVATVGLRGTIADFYVDAGGDELLHMRQDFADIDIGGGVETLIGPAQFALVRDGELIVGPVTGSILEIMARHGFPYPRGLAERFLTAADGPSEVPAEEIERLLAGQGPPPEALRGGERPEPERWCDERTRAVRNDDRDCGMWPRGIGWRVEDNRDDDDSPGGGNDGGGQSPGDDDDDIDQGG